MGNPIQIVSTAGVKEITDMTPAELKIAISDLGEIYEYLTREGTSYEEKCFSESVVEQINRHRAELNKREQ